MEGIKNKPVHLNNHLYDILERLSDQDISNDELELLTKKADVTIRVGNCIIENNRTQIEGLKVLEKMNFTPKEGTLNQLGLNAG